MMFDRIARPVVAARSLTAALLLLAAAASHASDRIVGVWWSSVTRIDCSTGAPLPDTFAGLQVFNLGGTLIDSNSRSPATRGPGMGTWKRVGEQVVANFRYMLFDGGNWTGTAVLDRTITLGAGGNTATATTTIGIYDPAGNLLGTGCAADVSERVG